MDEAYDLAVLLLNLAYIPMKNASTQAKFTESALALKAAADQFGAGSPQYQAARDQHRIDFAAHVRSLLVSAKAAA